MKKGFFLTALIFFLAFLSSISNAQTMISACSLINISGAYQMNTNILGAPINASPLTQEIACVKINVSHVDFNCAGYNITENGTMTSDTRSGILAIDAEAEISTPVNNITVRNCNLIRNYSRGVFFYNTNNSSILNVNVSNSSSSGIIITASSNSRFDNIRINLSLDSGIRLDTLSAAGYTENITLSNITLNNNTRGIDALTGNFELQNLSFIQITAFNNSDRGISLDNLGSVNIINSTISFSTYGIWAGQVRNSTFRNLTIFNTTSQLIYAYGTPNRYLKDNVFADIRMYGSDYYGFQLGAYASQNNLSNITIYNITGYPGLSITDSNYTIINNLTVNKSQDGIELRNLTFFTNLSNITSYRNANNGIYVELSNYTIINNASVYNNTNIGILLEKTYYGIFGNISAYDNSIGIDLNNATFNNLSNSTAYNNTEGIRLRNNASNNRLWNITGLRNNIDGIQILTNSSNNTLWGIAAFNNANGIIATTAIFLNISNFTLYNNTGNGILFETANLSVISNGSVYDDGDGIEMWRSVFNNISDITGYNNTNSSIIINNQSHNTTIWNGLFYNSSFGISIINSTAVNVSNIRTTNHTDSGIYLDGANHSRFVNLTVSTNIFGFRVNGTINMFSVFNSTFYNNTRGDYNSTATLRQSMIFNNSNFGGHSRNITLNASNGSLFINSTGRPASLPGGYDSLNGIYIRIENRSFNVTLNFLQSNWLESDESSADRNTITLFNYTSAWGEVGSQTLQASNRRIMLLSSPIAIAASNVWALLHRPAVASTPPAPAPRLPELSGSIDSDCNKRTVKVSGSGGSIRGANVDVTNTSNSQTIASGVTDSSGKFEFNSSFAKVLFVFSAPRHVYTEQNATLPPCVVEKLAPATSAQPKKEPERKEQRTESSSGGTAASPVEKEPPSAPVKKEESQKTLPVEKEKKSPVTQGEKIKVQQPLIQQKAAVNTSQIITGVVITLAIVMGVYMLLKGRV